MLSQTSSNLIYENLHRKDVSSNQETSSGFPEHFSSSSMSALSFGSRGITRAGKLASLAPPRRFSTCAERITSPKTKNTGAETREELFNSLLSRFDSMTAAASGVLPAMIMEMSRVMSSILQNTAELMEEVESLRKENQQLHQLL
ncbi:hypothetical protein GOBAR_AA37857 [Gossypium barbadense]|uniref:Uncharacterized protein n=1 Tax=Gossypium barbadense TaxID=3634 RepID=A0A2P5VVN3_GOSBA|nr:hypothetical protein GOBAR_AA37857 [Gossypium barbadense]